jgi:hypothetical protein
MRRERGGQGSLVRSGLAAQAGDSTVDEVAIKLSRWCSARKLSRFKAASEDRETGQNREVVAREKSGGCCGEMEVQHGGGGGGWQQAAVVCWLRDVFRKKKRRGKTKREEVGRLGQKNGPRVELDWASLKRWMQNSKREWATREKLTGP